MSRWPGPDPASPGAQARRRFLKTVGLAGLSSALAPAALSFAQSSAPPPAGSTPPATPAPATTPAATPPEPPSEDAWALAAIIRRRYGKNLSGEQIESIAKDFDGDLKAGKRLHEVKLTNGDEPDFTFHS